MSRFKLRDELESKNRFAAWSLSGVLPAIEATLLLAVLRKGETRASR